MRNLRAVRAIAWVTFLEIIRDRVLYNIIVVSALLFALGFLASRLNVFSQDRLLVNFGLSGLSISCLMIAIFTGATLIGREYDRRTIFVALSRPISRLQFVWGKFGGLCGVLLVNWAGMIVALGLLLLAALGGQAGTVFSPALFAALGLILLQSFVLSAIALFFSSFSTTSISVMFTLGLYLVGTNSSQVRLLATHVKNPLGAAVLNAWALIMPNFENFNLGTLVTYRLPLPNGLLIGSVSYGLAILVAFVVSAGLLIGRRES